VAIGHELATRGWDLAGYKPDKSDSMTDYFDPAHWSGIARRDGVIVLCDVSGYDAGCYGKPQPRYGRADGPCSACGGTGQATETAIRLGFAKPGPCERCGGTGHAEEHGRIIAEDPAIPHVRPCPGRWMVIRETDGRVLGTGQRPLAADSNHDEKGRAAIQKTADDIEAAARKATSRTAPQPAPVAATAEVNGATVRPSTVRAGYVEIVHPAKPEQPIREELKAAGFRWAIRSRCWYGPAEALPSRYAPAPQPGEGV